MSHTRFGKYILIAELGRGGMADVFLAVQPGPLGSRIRKLVCLKRLRQNLAEDPEFIAMLVDEARIAGRLNHPNVVQTYEVDSIGEVYFIAMEYLDGQPLHRVQQSAAKLAASPAASDRAKLTPEQQYIVLMDTLAGLQHAHSLLDFDDAPLNIVHRDVTPHNIFVTYDGQVKVVDFGIAKAAGRSSETRQGIVKGKVRYMAPEQAVSTDVDARTDVFAAGIMLWEMATGRRFWKDMDDFQIVQALVQGQIQSSPRAVSPDVPEAIDLICKKALAPKREDRYASASEFRDDIESYLGKSGSLISARKQLTRTLNDMFREKRIELRMVVERQLEALERRDDSPPNDESSSNIVTSPSQAKLPLASHSSSGSHSLSGSQSFSGSRRFVITDDVSDSDPTRVGAPPAAESTVVIQQPHSLTGPVARSTSFNRPMASPRAPTDDALRMNDRSASVQFSAPLVQAAPKPERWSIRTVLVLGAAATAVVLIASVMIAARLASHRAPDVPGQTTTGGP